MTTVCMILISVLLHLSVAAARQSLLQHGIADEVLRFHVLANSDSEEDQRIKLCVRDAVLEYLSEHMQGTEETAGNRSGYAGKDAVGETAAETGSACADRAQAKDEMQFAEKSQITEKTLLKQYLTTHLPELTDVANCMLASEGADYRAVAALETCYFPDRTYGACTFPAGYYEALRIRLGEARGHNWWCVLYPRLCFTDCLHAVVEEEQLEQLEEVLTVEEYDTLLQEPGRWKVAFRWF